MRYAFVVGDVIDSIAMDRPALWVPAVRDEEGNVIEPGHYDEVLLEPGWEEVGDYVYGGWIRDGDDWKAPPPPEEPPADPDPNFNIDKNGMRAGLAAMGYSQQQVDAFIAAARSAQAII